MSMPSRATMNAHSFYLRALHSLHHADIDFLVGGAYALEHYTGISRDTKDLDVFVRPEDCERVLAAFAESGFDTELTFPHWLGKARAGSEMVDVIFSSGNGCARVDDEWFQHGVADEVMGVPVRLIPVEEMIWSKGLIMERERFDGADVNPSPARPRRRARLVAGAVELRLEVARPPLAPDPLRLRLSRPPRRHPRRRHA